MSRRIFDQTYYERNKETILLKRKAFYLLNADRIKANTKSHREKVGDQRRPGYHKEWQANNWKKCLAAASRWRERHLQYAREVQNTWNKTHKAYRAYMSGCRRAAKLRATPPWLTDNHYDLIAMKYELAYYLTECTGIQWDVDHIIPLQGRDVSGLHVPWNLRVIPESENCQKSNHFEPK